MKVSAGKILVRHRNCWNNHSFVPLLRLIYPVVSTKVEEPVNADNPDFIEDMQVRGLNSLLDVARLKISANENRFGEKALQLNDYVTAVHKGIWKGLKEKKVVITAIPGLCKKLTLPT